MPAQPPVTGQTRSILISPGPFYKRTMSYWSNAWREGQTVYVFAGDPARGGPAFFEVDLTNDTVKPWDAKVPHMGETEGWEWTADRRIQLAEGPRLHRVNPFTGGDGVLFDIGSRFPGHTLWQPHTSPSGRTVTATVKDPNYQKIATVVFRDGVLTSYAADGTLDESAPCGDEFVVIKQGENGEDNLIVNLDTGAQRWIRDHGRAIGHSDCWPPYLVGEADKPDPGGCGVWDLRDDFSFTFLFPTLNMGYIAAKAGRYLHSDDTHLALLTIETGARTIVLDHGVRVTRGEPNYYDDRVKAALDWSGTVATYMKYGALYLVVLSRGEVTEDDI